MCAQIRSTLLLLLFRGIILGQWNGCPPPPLSLLPAVPSPASGPSPRCLRDLARCLKQRKGAFFWFVVSNFQKPKPPGEGHLTAQTKYLGENTRPYEQGLPFLCSLPPLQSELISSDWGCLSPGGKILEEKQERVLVSLQAEPSQRVAKSLRGWWVPERQHSPLASHGEPQRGERSHRTDTGVT